jgi:hypothetical protein
MWKDKNNIKEMNLHALYPLDALTVVDKALTFVLKK